MQESYIIICVCCIANFKFLKFNRVGVAVNSTLALLAMSVLLVYTAFSYGWIRWNRTRLEDEAFKHKYGYLYENLKTNQSLHELKEPMFQNLRALVLILALLLLQSQVALQLIIAFYI